MKAGIKCPTCKQPSAELFKPFCSQRCADVDLGRWLNGSYRVETNEAPETATNESPANPNEG